MSTHVHKSHNVSLLLYHFVCPAKYRKKIFTAAVEASLKKLCAQIKIFYKITFVEISAGRCPRNQDGRSDISPGVPCIVRVSFIQ